jgi:hypothetical protein
VEGTSFFEIPFVGLSGRWLTEIFAVATILGFVLLALLVWIILAGKHAVGMSEYPTANTVSSGRTNVRLLLVLPRRR